MVLSLCCFFNQKTGASQATADEGIPILALWFLTIDFGTGSVHHTRALKTVLSTGGDRFPDRS
jgi:hypothetical protein